MKAILLIFLKDPAMLAFHVDHSREQWLKRKYMGGDPKITKGAKEKKLRGKTKNYIRPRTSLSISLSPPVVA